MKKDFILFHLVNVVIKSFIPLSVQRPPVQNSCYAVSGFISCLTNIDWMGCSLPMMGVVVVVNVSLCMSNEW